MEERSNLLYVKQFLIMCFVSSLSYKVVMLPQYLCKVAERQAYLTMLYLMTIELLMLGIVYGLIKKGGLLTLNIPKPLKKIACVLILVSCFFKSTTFITETLTYVSVSLFEYAGWTYIILALLPALCYLGNKGINTISRTCQIIFWFMLCALLFSFLFTQTKLKIASLTPIILNGTIFQGGDKHLMWFGDFTPFLFATLAPSSKKNRIISAATMALILVFPTFTMIALIGNYGGGAEFVSNAFSKLAIYNRISSIVGTVDFPIVCAWLMMTIIKLSFVMCGLFNSAKYLFKDNGWTSVICSLALGIFIMTVIVNQDKAYALATSWVRYIVAAIEYLLPMVIYIAMRIYDPNHEKFYSTDIARNNKITGITAEPVPKEAS